MISSSAEATIVQKLEALEASDSTQVAVLTIPSLEGEDLEGFSIRVAEAWKIGTKENDNGAILLVSRDDREVRLEVGYGLEGKLTDLMSGRIVDQIIVPNFKAGRYRRRFRAGRGRDHRDGQGRVQRHRQAARPDGQVAFLHTLSSSRP